MGYAEPWYSVRDVGAPAGESMGSITRLLRDGERAFLTYSTTGRGNEVVNGPMEAARHDPRTGGVACQTTLRGGQGYGKVVK